MKTCKGIHVDLIDAQSGLKPLDFETDDGTIFVRMPHGQFKVRIVTPQPADVQVTLDNEELLAAQAQAGSLVLLDKRPDGTPFTFAEPGQAPARTQSSDEPEQLLLFAMPAPKPSVKHSHGLVAVQVRFSDQPASKHNPGVHNDKPELVFFQMNVPADHARTLAASLHKVVPPEGITRRKCSCCP